MSSTSDVKTFTMEEVSQHNQKGDCWIVYEGKVYDVSKFDKHPGGDAILRQAGQDATESMQTVFDGHDTKAAQYLPTFYIGDLQ